MPRLLSPSPAMIASPRFWFVLLGFGLLQAAEPPSAPLLRIEAGMHTTMIRRIATDASGRLALTSSDDKTARLWQLPEPGDKTGRAKLLRVFRVPIGAGNEGKLYTCALSPDGSIAALGGYTGYEWDAKACLYLIDTATGQILRRLGDLPQVINELAFSASGQHLAAGLGSNGIRVWQVDDGRLLAEDRNYKVACYGIDWQGEEVLASSGDDGRLRLYQLGGKLGGSSPHSLKPDHEVVSPGGKQPRAIRFSPDGETLAVGYSDQPKVTVHRASDLRPLKEPDCSDTSDSLHTVAWSTDGRSLVAGGKWSKAQEDGSWKRMVRLWTVRGTDFVANRDMPATADTMMDLRALPGGGFLFASGEPSWGVAGGSKPGSSSAAVVRTLGAPPIANFLAKTFHERFQIQAEADLLTFEYGIEKRPATFDLRHRRLTASADLTRNDLHRPKIQGLEIKDIWLSLSPMLNGKPLALKTGERSLSLCIAPDAAFFLLGCDFSLRCYNAQGQQLWEQAAPSSCWAVNLSKDGRVAVAAYSDGTIRWHDVADFGREVMAFFPHVDGKRWVLWAEAGKWVDAEPSPSIGTVGSKDAEGGGVQLIHVLDGMPAALAGLKAGDVITMIDGTAITNLAAWGQWLAARPAGTEAKITFRRGSIAAQTVEVRVGSRVRVALDGVSYFISKTETRLAGLRRNCAAYLAGLRADDVILKIGDRDITGSEEFATELYLHKPGDELLITYRRGEDSRSLLVKLEAQKIWQPTGTYYDASPGGEELLGWHINQGKDQAPQWVELGRFRDIAYRPDVFDHLLDTWDVGEALRLADAARPQPVLAADTPEPARPMVSQQDLISQRLPPVVTWVGITGRELAFDQPRVTLRYQVRRPPGQKLRGMALWVNGERTSVLPPAPADNETVAEVTLPVPSRHSHVMLQADGPYNSSELLDLNLRWTGAVGGAAPMLKPKLHALVIGVGDYQDPKITPLACAVADARRFAETLKRQEGRRYQEVRVQLLTSDAKDEAAKATFGNITKQLSWLRTSAAQPDVSMVYLVGHGLPDPEPQADGGTPDLLFALADYQEGDESTRISVPFVRDRLAKLAGKTFLFLDTCHSGLVENLNLTANRTLGWKSAQQTASTKAAEQVAEAGVVAFSACRGNQFAKEDLTLGHGYFTLAVTEGLDGKADLDGSTEVTVAELTRYVADRVNEFSGGQQTAWKAPLESLHEGFVLSHPAEP